MYSKRFILLNSIALFVLAWIIAACFRVRQPEPPITQSDWNTPIEPAILIENFRKSVVTLNLNNYERCFASGVFRFLPDPTVARNNTGLFSRWTLQEELEYMKNIQAVSLQVNGNQFQLSNIRNNFITIDSVEYIADYNLTVFHQDTSYKNFSFNGNMIVYLRRNLFNEWEIAQWQDQSNSEKPCWTELKEKFSTN
jgi:hypothetical protein